MIDTCIERPSRLGARIGLVRLLREVRSRIEVLYPARLSALAVAAAFVVVVVVVVVGGVTAADVWVGTSCFISAYFYSPRVKAGQTEI